jgi:hypothetical protein
MMATPTSNMSQLSLDPAPSTIDLTADDYDDYGDHRVRMVKRMRTEGPDWQKRENGGLAGHGIVQPAAGYAPMMAAQRQVIDLTQEASSASASSSSTPTLPQVSRYPSIGTLPPDLPPKTPVCIGQLAVIALVIYPSSYLAASAPSSLPNDQDYVPVKLQYEQRPPSHASNGPTETIHIKTPGGRTSTGEVYDGETFGAVEQKVTSVLGHMFGKGLIRLDGRIKRGGSASVRDAFCLSPPRNSPDCSPAPYQTASDSRLNSQRQRPRRRQLSPPSWPSS